MGGLLVIGFFVLFAVGVVLVAMRGGPKASIKQTEPARSSRRGTAIVAGLVIAAFGIGLPAFILIDANDNQAFSSAGGSRLTSDQRHGRALFARNCATCHTLSDAGAVGKVGPNLDVLRPVASTTIDAIARGRANGRGQMPKQLLNSHDARQVASYVQRVAGH